MVNLYRVIDNLISLVNNKYEQLKDIYLLTKEQTSAIEESDMTTLLELIDKKQQKIDLIVTFDSQFEAITDDIKTIYDVKSLDELDAQDTNLSILKEKISNVTDILHQIIQIENSNRDKINESKHQLEMKMNKAQTGKVAIKQYSGINGYADAVFFDRKIK